MAEADVEMKTSKNQIATLERENNDLKREQFERAALERELKKELLERDEVSLTLSFLYPSNSWSGRRNQGI